MERRRGHEQRIALPRWIDEDLELGRLLLAEAAVLLRVWLKANPYTGTLKTCASRIASCFDKVRGRAILDALTGLKRKRYVWYEGEQSGQQLYYVFVNRYIRVKLGELNIYRETGELAPGFSAYVKKVSNVDAGFFSPRKRTPTRSPRLDVGVTVGDLVGARAPDPPKSEGLTEGLPGGSRRGSGLTIAGLSTTDGGQLRGVPRGAGVGARRRSRNDQVHSFRRDPPKGPPAGGSPSPVPPAPDSDEARQLETDTWLAVCRQQDLLDELLGKKGRRKVDGVDRTFAAQLVKEHGLQKVEQVLEKGLKHPFWGQHSTTFKKLAKHWDAIELASVGGGNDAKQKRDRAAGVARSAEADPSQFYDSDAGAPKS